MRVFIRTFGCRANHYDSEAVRAILESAGHTMVANAAGADLAVFNSCAVTAEAESDLRKAVRRAVREQPGLRSVIMGCAAALADAEHALGSLPGVEHVIAGADLPAIARAVGVPPSTVAARALRQTTTRAVLRIQDGCDEHCTFCVTTLARGANRSRPVDEIIREAQALAEHHPEIVVTGIHIGSYGQDRGYSLGSLLGALVREVPTVRFRLSSLEATEVDDELRELLTSDARRVAPYLHAPLQSGSDRLLKLMGRHWYTASTYARAVERLMGSRSLFGLGADVITGFPGESEEDHRHTIALVEDLPFTYLHVFPYSPRPGTAALRLAGAVPAEVAARRARELRDLSHRKAAAYHAARSGGMADVIVVRGGAARAAGPEGLTEDYLTVRATEATLPRGARVAARLRLDGDALLADTSELQ
jgi:threonylcarbamoyladenosine tRNA methylthiotransferase MtaB